MKNPFCPGKNNLVSPLWEEPFLSGKDNLVSPLWEEPFISRKNEILNSSLLRDSNECIGDGECHYTYTFKTIFNSYIIMSISLLELVVNGPV